MSVARNLSRSSSDERLKLLLQICDVKELYRNNDKAALRDIASVVGGDIDHIDSFVIQVKSWLKEFKEAVSTIALSSGFRSTGLTAALTHPSFLTSSGGASNGIIFDELTDFNDPTGVLAGAITIVEEKVSQLTSVSGVSTKSQLRAQNFSRMSAIENELSPIAERHDQHQIGTKSVKGGCVIRDGAANQVIPYTQTHNEVLRDTHDLRSTIVGPRFVTTNVKESDDVRLEVMGGLSSFSTSADAAKTKLVTARYVIVGVADRTIGAVPAGSLGGFGAEANFFHGAKNRATDTGVCLISDTDLAKLQSGPVIFGSGGVPGPRRIVSDRMPGGRDDNAFYGLKDNEIVIIPLSGLDDVLTNVSGVPYDNGDVTQMTLNHIQDINSPLSDFMETSGTYNTISLNRYMKLAKKVLPTTNFDTVMVMDMVSVIDAGGMVAGLGAAVGVAAGSGTGGLVEMSITGSIAAASVGESLLAVVSSDSVTENVRTMRRAWDDSKIIRLVSGFDAYASRTGDAPVVTRALSELISGAYRNTPYILNDVFKQTLIDHEGLAAAPTTDQVFEKLQNSAITGTYADGLDASMWIGPNDAASRMKPLTDDGKNGIFKKWMRTLDYITLIALMTIDYADSQRD
uniref:Uncharacterized protein n=1 Tax=viral metagenome TaxID=1070528 RepID=A0A2V0RM31_9ZZZZ